MPDDVPSKAAALRSLVENDQLTVSLEEVDVPAPGPEEVLIRVEAAPINPSDLGLLLAGANLAGATGPVPGERPVLRAPLSPAMARATLARAGEALAVGNEGAGTVVAAGGSDTAQRLLGRSVSVAGGGMYAQYRCAPAASCLELPEGVSAVDGASSFVNPMTVLGMVETMALEGHRAIVHTAAASNLGQMLVRVCAEDDIPLVNIVRSAQGVRVLRDLGARHVLDSSARTFAADLVNELRRTSATLAFDAIGGGLLSSQILTAMEAAQSTGSAFTRYGSGVHKQVYVYGGLDPSPTELRRSYGMAWGIGGWLVGSFLERVGPDRATELRRRVAGGITTTFASGYAGRVTLDEMLQPETARVYARQATGQKYLVIPNP